MALGGSNVRALILVAHADDETLGAGGLMQKLRGAHWDVRVVIMSDGVVRTRTEVCDNRQGARNACAILDVPEPLFLGFADQKFDTVAVADLANAVLALAIEPDLICTHTDTDLNRDHRMTAEVARIVGRPRKKPVAIVGCEIPNTSFWNGTPFMPNYYVDITTELDKKIAAFSCYGNEMRAFPDPWSSEGLRLLAAYHGMQAGYRAAEAYVVVRAGEGLLL